MPFLITTTRTFSAAHQLRLYDGSIEPIHGHNWRVEVTVSAAQLDAIGVVMDFHELERLLDEIIQPMHNRHLNELPMFARLNPSAENVAKYFYDEVTRLLRTLPPGAHVTDVILWETDTSRAQYRPGA